VQADMASMAGMTDEQMRAYEQAIFAAARKAA
jgi:hypothetical protein